ncbi:MAG TPA: TetR family transcriptional regulator, partial [Marmoricola sp.]|nr:TetR family transcriptional regulator [Marmoricola sp.]
MGNHGWGGNPPESDAAARQRIIDAAAACIDRHGVAKTTLSDVAQELGVTGQLGPQDLAGDHPGKPHVVGGPHLAHAADRDPPGQAVALREHHPGRRHRRASFMSGPTGQGGGDHGATDGAGDFLITIPYATGT